VSTCTFWDGSAVVGERTFDNIIPTPYFHVGSASVSLTFFVDASVIRSEAGGVRLELTGDPTYVEQVE
jgi:hypothetical protein